MQTGQTLGILGGGQLGRMIANEARRLGYKVAVMDPGADCSARGAADHFVQGTFDDAEAVAKLTALSDLVTLETEHIPAELLEKVEAQKPLRPKAKVFWHIQDRLRQRQLLESVGVPQPAWRGVADADDAKAAYAEIGPRVILKSRRGGYDGKGQVRLQEGDDPATGFAELGAPGVMEGFVDFDYEVSILVARGLNGETATFPIAKNEHRGGILHITTAPTQLDEELLDEAASIASSIADALEHVGVLCVELFVCGDKLLVNEVAPRVHNSGHYTLGACVTSQFEQHVRAICGLPLGETLLMRPAAMLNLLGDSWQDGEPDWNKVHATPGASLHLYGKADARPGRKMGHINVLADSLAEAVATAERLHNEL